MNPFKKGDLVRRIKYGCSTCEVGSEHIVYKVKDNSVYYKDGHSSHYLNWELVTKSEPKNRQQTELYFKSMQIAHDAGVELLFTNSSDDDTWTGSRYIPLEQWEKHSDWISKGDYPARFKQANLPIGCPSNQYSDEYFEFWNKTCKICAVQLFNYEHCSWFLVNAHPSKYKNSNRPQLFRLAEIESNNLTSVSPNTVNVLELEAAVDSCSQQITTTKKENIMKKDLNIKLEINGEQVNCSSETATEDTRTDLEKAGKYLVEEYNPNGTYVCMRNTITGKDVKRMLQKPTNLGKTFRIYKFDKAFTTAIPVVELNK